MPVLFLHLYLLGPSYRAVSGQAGWKMRSGREVAASGFPADSAAAFVACRAKDAVVTLVEGLGPGCAINHKIGWVVPDTLVEGYPFEPDGSVGGAPAAFAPHDGDERPRHRSRSATSRSGQRLARRCSGHVKEPI